MSKNPTRDLKDSYYLSVAILNAQSPYDQAETLPPAIVTH